MKTLKQIIEAAGREITVNWDMGRDFMHEDDWAEQYNVHVTSSDSSSIDIMGTEKNLLAWLTKEYGMDKKEAQQDIKKGKRVKV
tara:strand:- start:7778 stop:8029 length:252 start_codon:yes stop_codon:yes gene_type:complete